jgi:S1-C subfamily serine protease
MSSITPIEDSVPSPYFLNINLVHRVSCPRWTGTAFTVGNGLVITAAHVSNGAETGGRCLVDGKPSTILYEDMEQDFAILGTETEAQHFVIDCEGYKRGKRYYAIGWAGGDELVVQQFIGTGARVSAIFGGAFKRQGILKGNSYGGMSGGPIVDERGFVVGLVNGGSTTGRAVSLSRELSQTVVCKDPK